MSDVRHAPSHEKYSAAGINRDVPCLFETCSTLWYLICTTFFFFCGKATFCSWSMIGHTRYVYQCTTGDHQRSNPGSALSASAIRESRFAMMKSRYSVAIGSMVLVYIYIYILGSMVLVYIYISIC